MSRPSIVRAALALVAAVATLGAVGSQVGFPLIAGAIGVRVGSPGAGVELIRVVLPLVFALSFAVLCLRFAVRALRRNVTVKQDVARGGKLLNVAAWTAYAWLAVELLYRQIYLGWATSFGNVGASLVWSSVAVALCATAERLTPWSNAPRGLRHLGLAVLVVVALLTGLSAWTHRALVPQLALLPVALVGSALLIAGVRRVESGPKLHALAELGLASVLLTGPIWSVFT
ncbi:MAG TPA: hypothetical protein VGK73_33605 [Polyangiaceae bacterium]